MHLLQQVVCLPVCGAESSRCVIGSESVLVCERSVCARLLLLQSAVKCVDE